MSPEEREAAAAALPTDLPVWQQKKLGLLEGDKHSRPRRKAQEVLERYFARRRGRGRRSIYLAAEMLVYYSGQECFIPDLFAVLDVDPHERNSWVVGMEGRGLDWVLEVLVRGRRKKDLVDNVKRYARLGIREYFVLDRRHEELHGFRLPRPGARKYQRLTPRDGRYESEVLGLGLEVKDGHLRFWAGKKLLLEATDALNESDRRRKDEARRRAAAERRLAREAREREKAELQRQEAERRRARAERQREEAERQREEAERRAAALQAELERLRRGKYSRAPQFHRP